MTWPAEPNNGPSTTHVAPSGTGNVFRYLFQTLLRGKWILIGLPALFLCLVIAYLAWTSPIYKSYSSLIIDKGDRGERVLDLRGMGADADVLVEVEVLRSLDIAKRVAGRLMDMQQGRAVSPYADIETFPIFGDGTTVVDDPLKLARRLQHTIDVDQVRRDISIIEIDVLSTRPEEAQLIANLYAEEYAQRNLEMSRQEAASLRKFVEEQLDTRSESLLSSEEALQAYQEQESAIALDAEARQLAQQMAALESSRDQTQVELEVAQAELSSLQAEIRQIEPGLYERVSSGLDREIATLQDEIARRKLEIENKYARNPGLRLDPSQDPVLVRNLQEIQALETQRDERAKAFVDGVFATGGIDDTGGGPLGQSAGALANVSRLRRQVTEKNIQVSGLQARLQVLGRRLQGYEREFERIPAQTRQLAILERQRLNHQTTYEWLQDKYEEARIAEESEFGYVQILDVAEVPDVPVAPRPLYSLVLGTLLGGVLAVVLIFGREMMDDRIRRPDDLKQFGYPLLGILPRLNKTVRMLMRKGWTDGQPLSPYLVTHYNPTCSASEAYHRVLSSLELAAEGERLLQIIMVTSPKNGEGKTVAAANLAAGLAQAGRRTLLVDTNLWNPQMHTLFGESMTPGLTNVLMGQAYMRTSVRPTMVPSLYLMPLGDGHTGASAFVASQDLEALLTYLRRSFDRIVIDAGALSAGSAVALTAMSDAVLMLVRAGKTRGTDLEEAREALAQIKAPYTGIVLNDFDAKAAFGLYSDRGYYGRYGSGKDAKPRSERRVIGFSAGENIATGHLLNPPSAAAIPQATQSISPASPIGNRPALPGPPNIPISPPHPMNQARTLPEAGTGPMPIDPTAYGASPDQGDASGGAWQGKPRYVSRRRDNP